MLNTQAQDAVIQVGTLLVQLNQAFVDFQKAFGIQVLSPAVAPETAQPVLTQPVEAQPAATIPPQAAVAIPATQPTAPAATQPVDPAAAMAAASGHAVTAPAVTQPTAPVQPVAVAEEVSPYADDVKFQEAVSGLVRSTGGHITNQLPTLISQHGSVDGSILSVPVGRRQAFVDAITLLAQQVQAQVQ